MAKEARLGDKAVRAEVAASEVLKQPTVVRVAMLPTDPKVKPAGVAVLAGTAWKESLTSFTVSRLKAQSAGPLFTALGYAEKVRFQFLSLRQLR
jgi:hypothetical protein